MPHTATITRSQFEYWAQAALQTAKPPSVRALAKVSGISKSTLSYQLNADSIPAASIIKISRGIGSSPLQDLASFPGYENLLISNVSPSRQELLALISPRDILLETARRLGVRYTHWDIDDFKAGKEYWGPWFKTAAPTATYSALRDLVGISDTQIAKNHKEASWSIEHMALMSQKFHFSIQLALAVSGSLSFREAELSPNIRQDALASATDEELQHRNELLATSLAEKMNKPTESEPKHVVLDLLG